ncbi:MAG: hypothetical protein ACK41O_26275, partial [Runella zeae]
LVCVCVCVCVLCGMGVSMCVLFRELVCCVCGVYVVCVLVGVRVCIEHRGSRPAEIITSLQDA